MMSKEFYLKPEIKSEILEPETLLVAGSGCGDSPPGGDPPGGGPTYCNFPLFWC